MDKNNVDKVVTILCALLFVLAVASLFTSCGQVRYVATSSQHLKLEKNVVHDTIQVTRVVRERVVEKEKDSTTVVVDDKGQEKSRDRIRERFVFVENQDSVNYYRSMADSLLSILSDSIEKPVIVERPLSKWQQWRLKWGDNTLLFVGVIFAFFIGVVGKKK